MKDKTIDIALDLGGDTIKIAFAYFNQTNVNVGKIAEKTKLTNIAVPAIAYYDEAYKVWRFCNDVNKQNDSFTTIVKIKNLLSLLVSNNQDSEYNRDAYLFGHNFPKFYFPTRRNIMADFRNSIESGYTFVANDYTPQKVCEMFFEYIKSIVDESVSKLSNLMDVSFSNVRISLVHPSNVGEEYINELSRIVNDVFGKAVYRVISSNKALSMLAFQKDLVYEKESFLVFDMGEESTSVVRASIEHEQIMIDGVEGHNTPCDIGGYDVDEAVVTFLDSAIAGRETLGCVSVDTHNQSVEYATYSKQYLLMKDIKKAKIIFSKQLPKDSVFADGVPVTVNRDVIIQRKISKEQLSYAIGAITDEGVANKLFEYILSEIKRPVNRDIDKIILAGGLAETYSLVDYFNKKLQENNIDVEIITFTNDTSLGNEFDICSYEDSVFAAAAGCAIIALKDIQIKMLVSLSYATWAIDPDSNKKIIAIFVDRGAVIGENGSTFTDTFNLREWGVDKGEEMFSTFATKKLINKCIREGIWPSTRSGKFIVGEPGSADRRQAEKAVDLKVVSGGKDGKIYFTYNDKQIGLMGSSVICFEEGIYVDKNGKATPILKNKAPHVRANIRYKNGNIDYVYLDKIKIVFSGINGFVVSND